MAMELEEVAVVEDDQDAGADTDNKDDVGNRMAVMVEEEEGEEEVAMPMLLTDPGNLGDFENVLKPCWGSTQMVLYESEVSSSDFGGSKSDLKDLQGTETWELDSNH